MTTKNTPKREDLTDDQLIATLAATENAQAAHKRTLHRFPSDAHRAIDESVAAAKSQVDDILRSNVYTASRAAGTPIAIPGLADAYILGYWPDIAERWHQLVDAEPASDAAGATFGPMDRPEYEAKRDELQATIDSLRQEQRYRQLEAQRAEAERELGPHKAASAVKP